MSSNCKKGKDWYQETTDRILELMEKGKVPWLCPFPRNGGFRNTAGHAYKGINQLHLLYDTLTHNWESVIYITTTELKNRKISFKGKSSCPVFKWITARKQVDQENETEDKTEVEEAVFLRLKYVGNVFNISQFPELSLIFQAESKPENIIESAQKIIDEMPNRPKTTYFPGKAFYSPSNDIVNIPSITEHLKKSSAAEYYSTAFHEYAHSTGHISRLNRKSLTKSAGFGSSVYSKEELIAEFTAAFLCGEAGIDERTVENSAAYIKSWAAKLNENNRLIVEAIQNAQHAADYILNRSDKSDEMND